MALNVAWRWSTPQIGDPSTVARQNQQGFQNFAEGLGQMIGDARRMRREDEQRQQAQANWQATFDRAKANADQTQANWEKTYALQKAAHDLNMETQKDYREWLKSMMVNSLKGGYANEDEYRKLLQIYGVNPQAGAQAIMLGLDPALARDLL